MKMAILSTPFVCKIAVDAQAPTQYKHAGHQIEANALPDLRSVPDYVEGGWKVVYSLCY